MGLFRTLIGLVAAPLLPTAAAAETIALINARVIDGTGAPPQDNKTVVIEDGRIAAIFDSGSRPPPTRSRSIDLEGLTLTPGLIDSHVHLMLPEYRLPGVSVDRAEIASKREKDMAMLLRSGITQSGRWRATLESPATSSVGRQAAK